MQILGSRSPERLGRTRVLITSLFGEYTIYILWDMLDLYRTQNAEGSEDQSEGEVDEEGSMLEDGEDEDEMMDDSTDVGGGDYDAEGLDEDGEWHGIGDGAIGEDAEGSDERTSAPQTEGLAEVPQTSQPASSGSLPCSYTILHIHMSYSSFQICSSASSQACGGRKRTYV